MEEADMLNVPKLRGLALLLVILPCAGFAEIGAGTAPALGVSSEFQFGSQSALREVVEAGNISDLRDGIIWSRVEVRPGEFELGRRGEGASDLLNTSSLIGIVTVFPQNPNYDGGATVTSKEGIEAFAKHVESVALAFPNLPSIEVANEFNTQSFVKGPAQQLAPLERADLYAQYLAEIAKRPGLDGRHIIGAATHSVAGGYIWRLLDQGAGAHMDAVSIHPYTSEAEQLPRQLDVLRRHPGMADLEIEVTEFGTNAPADAPDKFWRMYCSMAMSDVSRAIWYPLRARGDGFAPLFQQDLRITPVGRAYLAAQQMASSRPVQFFRPDPFTSGCVFDGRLAVIWGAPRTVDILRDDVEVLWADTRKRSREPAIEESRVLILTTKGAPIDLDTDVVLGASDLIADSYYQFDFPAEGEGARDGDSLGFDRFLQVNGEVVEFATCPGQETRNVPWFPYLCAPQGPASLLHGRGFVLGARERQPMELVHQFNVSEYQNLAAEVTLNIKGRDSDGVGVRLEHDGRVIDRQIATGDSTLLFSAVPVVPGDTLALVIDSNDTLAGDVGELRIRLRDAGAALTPLE